MLIFISSTYFLSSLLLFNKLSLSSYWLFHVRFVCLHMLILWSLYFPYILSLYFFPPAHDFFSFYLLELQISAHHSNVFLIQKNIKNLFQPLATFHRPSAGTNIPKYSTFVQSSWKTDPENTQTLYAPRLTRKK